jgi:hypothetical protein
MIAVVEYFFGEWILTGQCDVGICGDLKLFTHSVSGRKMAVYASLQFGRGVVEREIDPGMAQKIVDQPSSAYKLWG